MVGDRAELERQLRQAQERMRLLEREKDKELKNIQQLQALLAMSNNTTSLANDSPSEEKVDFFRRLFHGRQDVYAKRWENAHKGTSGYQPAYVNEWVEGKCTKGSKSKVKCHECAYREFLPLTNAVITSHLLEWMMMAEQWLLAFTHYCPMTPACF